MVTIVLKNPVITVNPELVKQENVNAIHAHFLEYTDRTGNRYYSVSAVLYYRDTNGKNCEVAIGHTCGEYGSGDSFKWGMLGGLLSFHGVLIFPEADNGKALRNFCSRERLGFPFITTQAKCKKSELGRWNMG